MWDGRGEAEPALGWSQVEWLGRRQLEFSRRAGGITELGRCMSGGIRGRRQVLWSTLLRRCPRAAGAGSKGRKRRRVGDGCFIVGDNPAVRHEEVEDERPADPEGATASGGAIEA